MGWYDNRSKDPRWKRWYEMVRRCTVPGTKEWEHYGGRGITVCQRWLDDFWNFAEDMGELPSPKHQLDRKDNDGNYEPSNCRWVTPSKNAANRPPNRVTDHYRGVEHLRYGYKAAIGVERQKVNLGTFRTPEEAAWRYDQAAVSVFGDDAYTNFEYV